MATTTPSIACIGIIGRHNNPLHISIFPPTNPSIPRAGLNRDPLSFSFHLSTSLDIFEARLPHKLADQDFGLLQAIDDRLSMYGYLTNTGVKFVVIVDVEGRDATSSSTAGEQQDSRATTPGIIGLRDADLKPVFRALQAAYINLLRNPFYDPDQHRPQAIGSGANDEGRSVSGSTQITSNRFIAEVKRIGNMWSAGIANL